MATLTALQAERKAKQEEANEAAAKPPPLHSRPRRPSQAAPSTENGFEFAIPPATPVTPATPAVETPEVARKTAA